MPDLIDTGDHDLLGEDNIESQNEQVVASQQLSSSLLIDDLFGDVISSDVSKSELRTDNDPFADVSFHTSEDKDQGNDLFAGMAVGESSSTVEVPSSDVPDPFDVFGNSEPLQMKGNQTNGVNNLMAGLSINGNGSMTNEKANYSAAFSQPVFSGSDLNPGSQGLNGSVSSGFDPQKATANANAMFPMGSIPYNISPGMFPGADSNPNSQGLNGSVSSDPQIPTTNANAMFPMGSIPYNIPPGMTYNQFYPAAPVNYGAMGGLLAQQQQFMAAAMANFQALGSLNSNNVASNNSAGTLGGNVSPLPDIFNAKVPTQASTVMTNTPKEETKAFDFITDHLTQARDPKRVT